MAFWGRIKQSKLETLATQFRRCLSRVHGSYLGNQKSSIARGLLLEKPNSSVIHSSHVEFGASARFFAAPAWAKPKEEEKEPSGPRLNEAITAQFVRLVTEEGHTVVSRYEALQRAKHLKMDLVEVQRNASPPVCKIMDHHVEMYKQQMKEKELAKKKKAEGALRSECKEVRFTVKTEQKDLQMKANMITGLMERGYRVKCLVNGFKGDDFEAVLSQLTALLEDVAVAESAPQVERAKQGQGPKEKKGTKEKKDTREKIEVHEIKEQKGKRERYVAYIVMRHKKFGAPKKSSKQVSGAVGAMDPDSKNISEDRSNKSIDNNIPTWSQSVSNADDDFNNVFDVGDDTQIFLHSDHPRPRVDSTRRSTRSEPQFLNQGNKQPQHGYGIFSGPRVDDSSGRTDRPGEVNRYKNAHSYDSRRQPGPHGYDSGRQPSPRGYDLDRQPSPH